MTIDAAATGTMTGRAVIMTTIGIAAETGMAAKIRMETDHAAETETETVRGMVTAVGMTVMTMIGTAGEPSVDT